MAQPRTKEPQVAREKSYPFGRMQKSKNFLLIIPFGSSHFKTDLPKTNPTTAKLFGLINWDVMVEDDHAAVLVFAGISLTRPRRVSVNASLTPFTVIRPLYWRAIASGEYPAFVSSSASETRIRVPLKIKRPRQTRVSAARCLPISIRAIRVFPPQKSLYELSGSIKGRFFLTGGKTADLSVEQPTKFEFVINLRTAKQIGLSVPPNVLARADRVIRRSPNPKPVLSYVEVSAIENPKWL
jgi:hypothetical protein